MLYVMYMYYFFIMILGIFLMLFLILIMNQSFIFSIEVFSVMTMNVELLIYLDFLAMMFLLVVYIISLMVMFYSIEYMELDKSLNRFMILIFLFVMSMTFMVISPNMISIMLGWDGLGFISYCLVIYYQSGKSYNSGMVTVLSNRIGDIFILLMISFMISSGSWNFLFIEKVFTKVMMLILLVISITKSAQIPFSSWLPLAMAAPTPVSSLVHSSTLVTAGVYLLIRFNNMLVSLNSGKFMNNLLMILSLVTMFMAGLGAIVENDLKKVIALSTLSQLGIMMFSLSMNLVEMAYFHLITHAMFKSMLFMCAGIIIHKMNGVQDIRVMGMMSSLSPFISMYFCCGSLSLCGVPFLSGFYSKDLILEFFLMGDMNKISKYILFMSMSLTVLYSFRLIYFVFVKSSILLVLPKSWSFKSLMGVSLHFLYIFAICLGAVCSWYMFNKENYIFMNKGMKLMIFNYMFIGLLMSFILQMMVSKIYQYYMIFMLITMMSEMWFLSVLYKMNLKKIFIMTSSLNNSFEGWNEYSLNQSWMNLFKIFWSYDFSFSSLFYLMGFVMILIWGIMIL